MHVATKYNLSTYTVYNRSLHLQECCQNVCAHAWWHALLSVHVFHQIRVLLQDNLSLHFKSWGQLSPRDAEIHWKNAEFLQEEDNSLKVKDAGTNFV